MKQVQKGFTLIELMIVVAIIGILAAVAIPAYQDYITKAKLAKVVSAVDSVKTAYASYAQENGGFPAAIGTNWSSLGIANTGPSTTTEIASFADATTAGAAGGFTITLTNQVSTALTGATITFTTLPAPGQTATIWNVTCVPTGATQPLLAKAFGCP